MKLLIVLLAFVFAIPVAADEPRKLIVTKFALKRLEKAKLTTPQRIAFDALTKRLRNRVHELREESGIDQEVIGSRDEAHKSLKELELEEAEYWKQLQSQAKLTDAQTSAFKETQELFAKYKEEVNNLLTDEQKKLIRKQKEETPTEE